MSKLCNTEHAKLQPSVRLWHALLCELSLVAFGAQLGAGRRCESAARAGRTGAGAHARREPAGLALNAQGAVAGRGLAGQALHALGFAGLKRRAFNGQSVGEGKMEARETGMFPTHANEPAGCCVRAGTGRIGLRRWRRRIGRARRRCRPCCSFRWRRSPAGSAHTPTGPWRCWLARSGRPHTAKRQCRSPAR